MLQGTLNADRLEVDRSRGEVVRFDRRRDDDADADCSDARADGGGARDECRRLDDASARAARGRGARRCVADRRGRTPSAQQKHQGPPNALQGFSQNRDQPVQIEAATLEVRDKDKIATFSGDVHVVQGDTDHALQVAGVHYDEEQRAGGMKAATPGPAGQQQIQPARGQGRRRRTQKDQTATGDSGLFDMRANTVTLDGQRGGQPGRRTWCAATGWWSI